MEAKLNSLHVSLCSIVAWNSKALNGQIARFDLPSTRLRPARVFTKAMAAQPIFTGCAAIACLHARSSTVDQPLRY
jgi:hypothetical protein